MAQSHSNYSFQAMSAIAQSQSFAVGQSIFVCTINEAPMPCSLLDTISTYFFGPPRTKSILTGHHAVVF